MPKGISTIAPRRDPGAASAVPRCPRCGRRHRSWRTYATCALAPLAWVCGAGPWASVSDCPRGRTVQLYCTRNDAEAAKSTIDRSSCGGMCYRWHRVVNLRTVRPAKGGGHR